jgi:hypothetical protein
MRNAEWKEDERKPVSHLPSIRIPQSQIRNSVSALPRRFLNLNFSHTSQGFVDAGPQTDARMTFALFDDESLIFAGYHAAVFVAVVFVLVAVQWLLERRRR